MGTRKLTLPASKYNNVLAPFKNIHNEQKGIILGNGPSSEKYKGQIDGIHFGMKASIRREDIKQEYYFYGDWNPSTEQDVAAAKDFYSTKFALVYTDGLTSDTLITPELAKEHNAMALELSFTKEFHIDIDKYCLYKKASIICACQFALFTGVSELYIVGADCDRNNKIDAARVDAFKKFKKFAKSYYPKVLIASINPVKLKGMFKDVYM